VEVSLTNSDQPSPTNTRESENTEQAELESPKEESKKELGAAELERQLEAAQAKADEHYDRLLRVSADFENYRKRIAREMEDLRKFGCEVVIREILPTVDNLERALVIETGGHGRSGHGLRQGVEMILKGLREALEKFDVFPMETVGQPFDPHFHQGISRQESDKHPNNTVLQELQKGYMIRDRLLRPAMVVVSTRPAAAAEAKTEVPEKGSNIDITVH
jgi:molecular chaperone GrpE